MHSFIENTCQTNYHDVDTYICGRWNKFDKSE